MKLLKVQRQFKRKESSEFPIFCKEEQGYPVATQIFTHGQGDFDGEEEFRAQEKELRRIALCMRACVRVCEYVCLCVCTCSCIHLGRRGKQSLSNMLFLFDLPSPCHSHALS